jgi:hypothetical protein
MVNVTSGSDRPGSRIFGTLDSMLQATRVGVFSSAYDVTLDGQLVTRWDKSMWRTGGSFTVGRQRYEVRGKLMGSAYTMTDQSGATVATAKNPNRRQWTVAAGGRTYEFRRRSWWRQHYDLVVGDQAVGFVRRPSSWRSTAVAELPTMPLAAQVFAVAVALTTWDAAAATTSG